MNPIRPNMLPPSTLAGGERQDTGKLAAQRAFFQAALSQAQGTAAPTAPIAAQTTAQVQRAASAAPSEQPQKILRPGSLIDIRV